MTAEEIEIVDTDEKAIFFENTDQGGEECFSRKIRAYGKIKEDGYIFWLPMVHDGDTGLESVQDVAENTPGVDGFNLEGDRE